MYLQRFGAPEAWEACGRWVLCGAWVRLPQQARGGLRSQAVHPQLLPLNIMAVPCRVLVSLGLPCGANTGNSVCSGHNDSTMPQPLPSMQLLWPAAIIQQVQ